MKNKIEILTYALPSISNLILKWLSDKENDKKQALKFFAHSILIYVPNDGRKNELELKSELESNPENVEHPSGGHHADRAESMVNGNPTESGFCIHFANLFKQAYIKQLGLHKMTETFNNIINMYNDSEFDNLMRVLYSVFNEHSSTTHDQLTFWKHFKTFNSIEDPIDHINEIEEIVFLIPYYLPENYAYFLNLLDSIEYVNEKKCKNINVTFFCLYDYSFSNNNLLTTFKEHSNCTFDNFKSITFYSAYEIESINWKNNIVT